MIPSSSLQIFIKSLSQLPMQGNLLIMLILLQYTEFLENHTRIRKNSFCHIITQGLDRKISPKITWPYFKLNCTKSSPEKTFQVFRMKRAVTSWCIVVNAAHGCTWYRMVMLAGETLMICDRKSHTSLGSVWSLFFGHFARNMPKPVLISELLKAPDGVQMRKDQTNLEQFVYSCYCHIICLVLD